MRRVIANELQTLKRWRCRVNLITVRMMLPVSRQVRSESDIENQDFSILQDWALERSGRLQSRARFQPMDSTDIIQLRVLPFAMSLSKCRRFTGCVTSYRSPYFRLQKAARTPSLWTARSTRSFEKRFRKRRSSSERVVKRSPRELSLRLRSRWVGFCWDRTEYASIFQIFRVGQCCCLISTSPFFLKKIPVLYGVFQNCRTGTRRSFRRNGRTSGLQSFWWSRNRSDFSVRSCRSSFVLYTVRLDKLVAALVTNRLSPQALVWSDPLESIARVLQKNNTSQSSSRYENSSEISCFSPSPSKLQTRSFLTTNVLIVSEHFFYRALNDGASFGPPNFTCQGWKNRSSARKFLAHKSVLTVAHWGTARLAFCTWLRSRDSLTLSRGRTNCRRSDPRQLLQFLWLVSRLIVPFSLCPHLHLLKTSHRSFSFQSPALSSSAGVLRFLVGGFVRCNVEELLTLIPPRSLSRSNCLTFLDFTGARLVSRLKRCRTRCPILTLNHGGCFPGISLSGHFMTTSSLFHFHCQQIGQRLVTDVWWIMNSTWPIEDIVLWSKDDGQGRDWQDYKYKSVRKSYVISVSQNWGLQSFCHKCHASFSKQSFTTREDFNSACWISTLRDNDNRVSTLPSFRCDINPTTDFNNLKQHLRKIVNSNEHHLSCRVIVFDQINQVFTRVKSKFKVIKESCACIGRARMTFTESRSFTAPFIILADTFFRTLSDQHRNQTRSHLSPQ